MEKINEALPQIQCGQCGYVGCSQYAEAVAKGEAPINLCIPGGQSVINDIAAVLGVEPVAAAAEEIEVVASINEDSCIGCGKCAKTCPVGAIAGGARMKHAVITQKCTGCKLCRDACPTDCILLQPKPVTTADWNYKLSDSGWEEL